MTNLVPEHTCKLIDSVSRFDQSSIHVDVATRESERIDRMRVHHREMPVEIGPRRMAGNRVAQLVDVGVYERVANELDLRLDLLRLLLPDGSLGVRRDIARRYCDYN